MSTLALDIGGANLKGATSSGCYLHEPFALYRHPECLADHLGRWVAAHRAERLLVTMTGELCDCFETKAQGVDFILGAVRSASSGGDVLVWSTRGQFLTLEQAREHWLEVAAANWHALATAVARQMSERASLLIDVGSTTTDLLPLSDGRVVNRGRSDPERLASGELVYLGIRRTPVASLLERCSVDGQTLRLMAEHFATTADAFVLLGLLPGDPERCDTADGRPLTVGYSAARLLRMIGSDLTLHSRANAEQIAGQVACAAIARLEDAAGQITDRFKPRQFILAGEGEALAARLARATFAELPCRSLGDWFGGDASRAACAHALLQLASDPEGVISDG